MVLLLKLKIDLISQEKSKEEIEQLSILFHLEIVIQEHVYTTANKKFAAIFVLINPTNRAIAWIRERPRCQNRVCGGCNSQTGSVDINKIYACSFALTLIVLLLLLPSSEVEAVIVTSFWLLRIAIDNSGHLFVQYPVVNVCFFRVEIFVKRSSDDAITVYRYSELASDFPNVGVIPI